jgi:hypothetical protein
VYSNTQFRDKLPEIRHVPGSRLVFWSVKYYSDLWDRPHILSRLISFRTWRRVVWQAVPTFSRNRLFATAGRHVTADILAFVRTSTSDAPVLPCSSGFQQQPLEDRLFKFPFLLTIFLPSLFVSDSLFFLPSFFLYFLLCSVLPFLYLASYVLPRSFYLSLILHCFSLRLSVCQSLCICLSVNK